MSLQEYFKSKAFKITLYIIAELIALLLVFQAGLFIGFRKANFSFGWGDNYHRNFGGPRQGFLREFRGDDFINSHGVAGSIIKIDNQSIVMKDGAGIEQVVNTNDQTSIKNGQSDLALKDLKTDDRIVVLGLPQPDGSIMAKMIRIFDGNFAPMMEPSPRGMMNNGPLLNNEVPPTGVTQPAINQIK